jgi:hypothetical protein
MPNGKTRSYTALPCKFKLLRMVSFRGLIKPFVDTERLSEECVSGISGERDSLSEVFRHTSHTGDRRMRKLKNQTSATNREILNVKKGSLESSATLLHIKGELIFAFKGFVTPSTLHHLVKNFLGGLGSIQNDFLSPSVVNICYNAVLWLKEETVCRAANRAVRSNMWIWTSLTALVQSLSIRISTWYAD